MSYTTRGPYGVETNKTMLGLMKSCRIFSAKPTSDGNFSIIEQCDDYFEVNLTKEQLLALAQELIDLANATQESPEEKQ